jgi:uncharacterized protein YndB with AHSA1/START domain
MDSKQTAGSRFVYVTYIRSTAEKVWAALTQPEFTKQYWAETWQESDWKAGSDWRLMIPDGRIGDIGTILEVDYPNKLVIRWAIDFQAELKAEGPTRVTYLLETAGTSVKLTLIQETEVPDSKIIAAMSEGWPHLLASLKSLLETGKPLVESTKWPEGH